MERHDAQRVRYGRVQLWLRFLGLLEQNVQDFLKVRNESFFEYFGSHPIDRRVTFFLLRLHVIIILAKFVEKYGRYEVAA